MSIVKSSRSGGGGAIRRSSWICDGSDYFHLEQTTSYVNDESEDHKLILVTGSQTDNTASGL